MLKIPWYFPKTKSFCAVTMTKFLARRDGYRWVNFPPINGIMVPQESPKWWDTWDRISSSLHMCFEGPEDHRQLCVTYFLSWSEETHKWFQDQIDWWYWPEHIILPLQTCKKGKGVKTRGFYQTRYHVDLSWFVTWSKLMETSFHALEIPFIDDNYWWW